MDIEVLNQVASKSAQISSTGGGGSNSSSGSDFADCNPATPATRNRFGIDELVVVDCWVLTRSLQPLILR